MSTTTTLEAFVQAVQRSGLVDEATLNELLRDFQASQASQIPQHCAEFLVREQALTAWQAGKLLQGKHKGYFLARYKLLKLLGKGGMSSVYLAEHTILRRRCAVKVLPWKLVKDSSYLERFLREAQAVASLDHPNIVRAYDVDREHDGPLEINYLVMEYVEGQNLFELVQTGGPVSAAAAADYIRQGALGLAHAHERGMVHRDVKPGNFIVDPTGTVKLMDLGLARVPQDGDVVSLTIAHDERVLGTADYLAPEQAVDSHLVDARADIYSLGCTGYFLLTGRPPFHEGTLTQRLIAHQTAEPTPLKQLRPDVPKSLATIIGVMMAKDPNARPQTATEVARQLSEWLEANGGRDWHAPEKFHRPAIVEKRSVQPAGLGSSRSNSGSETARITTGTRAGSTLKLGQKQGRPKPLPARKAQPMPPRELMPAPGAHAQPRRVDQPAAIPRTTVRRGWIALLAGVLVVGFIIAAFAVIAASSRGSTQDHTQDQFSIEAVDLGFQRDHQ